LDTHKEFILIDDSKIDLLILERLLKTSVPNALISKFDRPDIAMKFLKDFRAQNDVYLFLDINMPMFNGFDFLDLLNEKLEEEANYYKVYMITSSQNSTDIARSKSYPIVLDVINKPINLQILLGLHL
jgi:two-component SAPR family response regulator